MSELTTAEPCSRMILIKKKDEQKKMREACHAAATVLDRMCSLVEPGVNTYDLDQAGKKMMEELGCKSGCFNYPNSRGNNPYPAYTCLSVNEEIVHGIGKLSRVLQAGDNITVDVVVEYNGYLGDNARTVTLQPASSEMEFLVKTTEEALYHAIDHARAGNRVGDISYAVEKFVNSRKFSIVREFVGHGIGKSMHEEPQIPNYGRKGRGEVLRPGMTLAIEPMVNYGGSKIEIQEDGWTALTKDNKPSAHFEHTILITEEEPEILTLPPEPVSVMSQAI